MLLVSDWSNGPLSGGRLTVRHNQPRERGLVDGIDGIATQDSMCNDSEDLASSVLVEGGGCLCELCRKSALSAITDPTKGGRSYSATSVRHVIHDDGSLILNVAHQHHATYDVGPRSFFVDQSESRVEAISEGCRTLRAASVRRDDDAVVDIQVLADPAMNGRFGVEVVHRYVEEALDLRGVQIHRDHMVLRRNTDE